MFQFIGYNFFDDGDALAKPPSQVGINDATETPLIKPTYINSVRLTNAIFDHLNISRDILIPFTTDIPSWAYDTIINAKFEGNLSGGNIEASLSQLSAVRVKRRKKGEFDWITLKEVPINKLEDLTFVLEDKLVSNNTEYEYAFVPITNDTEGNYTIISILSKFRGVFIGDADTVFKFLYDVSFNSNGRVQQVGTFEPLGRKYPVLIANGELNYATGSVSATIMNDDYDKTGVIDRKAIVEKKEKILDYLSDHKAKLLRDWNGNAWLIGVVGNPQIAYRSGSGMGVPQLTFNWTEIGDAESRTDLYNNGIIDSIE